MQRFNDFWNKKSLERYLLTVVGICLVFLVVLQLTHVRTPYQGVIDQVGSDAQAMSYAEVADTTIILQLVNYSTLPKARVLVNGQVKGDFTHPYVTLSVADGDLLEVDTSFYRHSVKVKVLETSNKIVVPEKGVEISGQQNILVLGEVKLLK
ncbi:hypothetical protein [Desulforamulus aquiferis]|uniref:PEGA domain-containing protein n=1 Tax=Desulforamulus aquiferis TaxID=1397668 RepID=A0AAW7ZB08_9FIRM|nr:hypothetical protein [Desulforamulus aquiferis]MDO7786478.1 hypothetical protein [Desulforamulus aquiferis]